MGFIQTILIIILVFYVIKSIFRLLIPVLIKRYADKLHDSFQEAFYKNHEAKDSSYGDGKVVIEKTKLSTNKESDNLGDYVDFEEVNE